MVPQRNRPSQCSVNEEQKLGLAKSVDVLRRVISRLDSLSGYLGITLAQV